MSRAILFFILALIAYRPAYSLPMVNAFVMQESGYIVKGDKFNVDFRISGIASSSPFFGWPLPLSSFSVGIIFDNSKLRFVDAEFKSLDAFDGGTPSTISGFPEETGSGVFSRGTQFVDLTQLADFQTSDLQFTLLTWTFEALVDNTRVPLGLSVDLRDFYNNSITNQVTLDSVYLPEYIPSVSPGSIPEPATIALFLIGIMGIIFCLRKNTRLHSEITVQVRERVPY